MTPSCRYLSQAIQILSGAIMASSVVFAEARAHESATGFVFPPECCHSAALQPFGDCDAIPSSSVVARPDGYHVTLGKGQHPKLITKGYSGVIPYQSTRKSNDGTFYICLSTDGASRFCFFAPEPGV